jgi:hypothetical protein
MEYVLPTSVGLSEGIACIYATNNSENKAKDNSHIDNIQYPHFEEHIVCFVDAVEKPA